MVFRFLWCRLVTKWITSSFKLLLNINLEKSLIEVEVVDFCRQMHLQLQENGEKSHEKY
jgi:hypothetical protein